MYDIIRPSLIVMLYISNPNTRTKLHEVGVRRTLASLQDTFRKWTDAGGNEKEAKHFGNVVHAPLLFGDPSVPVLDILPPPELHLELGGVNTLYSGIYNIGSAHIILNTSIWRIFVCA